MLRMSFPDSATLHPGYGVGFMGLVLWGWFCGVGFMGVGFVRLVLCDSGFVFGAACHDP